MTSYEDRRQANIARNKALLDDLGIAQKELVKVHQKTQGSRKTKTKIPTAPTRVSTRIASAPIRPTYNDGDLPEGERPAKRQRRSDAATIPSPSPTSSAKPKLDISDYTSNWYDWKPAAEPPTRSSDGTFHFTSHPRFQPNKSPLEMLQEGAFGGSYYRPLRSRTLGETITDDWQRLPQEWLDQLDIERQLINQAYDPEVNKFGVKCGQSIEEWEAAGWINAEWDVRGWFQWYERFFRGRRGDDDNRQVGRWDRCVGERGRWRRALVKGFQRQGVKDVADEGLGDGAEVSPVLCQTCHHWGWEMRQEYLDLVWAGKV